MHSNKKVSITHSLIPTICI